MKTRNVQSLEEHVHFLIHKIYEELSEVRDADDEDAQVDEYADLLEVADTILCLSMDPEWKRYISFSDALHFHKSIVETIRISDLPEEKIYEKKLEKLQYRWWFREWLVWIY